MKLINILVIFLLINLTTSCSQNSEEESSSPKTVVENTPDDNVSTESQFIVNKEVFLLENSQFNIKEEKVILSDTANYTWSLTKNVDYGTIQILKNNNDLEFDYTPNLTINNVLDSFSIKIRYIEDGKIKEKNFNIKVQVGEVSDSNYNGGDSGSGDNEEIFKLTWKTVINKPDKSSFNEKVIDSNFNKTFSYEIVKDVCGGDIFYNKVGDSLYISYTPTNLGTEKITIKVTQEKDDGSFLVEEKDVFLNIGGVSAPKDCTVVENPDTGGGDTGSGGDTGGEVVSDPEESHSWVLEHFFNDYLEEDNLFFTSTFQNFFSYEIVKNPCSGNLSIIKEDNTLKFRYDPVDGFNTTESFIIKIRQKRSENVDLVVQKEIKINVLQSGEINNSCVDNGDGGDTGSGGDTGGGDTGSGGDTGGNVESIVINNPINLDTWEPQILNLVENNLENPNFTFNILENPCKGDFSISSSGNKIIMNYDPLDNFFGTQSFKLEYIFYNETNTLEKQEISFFINIKGESSVDNSCREETDNGGDTGSGGGVIGGGGNSGSDGQAGENCNPLVIADCDDGTVENPEEIVELGYQYTFVDYVLIPQNQIFNGDFGLGTPPGSINRTILEDPKKGILEFLPEAKAYKYTPYKNHVGLDTFKVNFEPLYGDGQYSGGTKTFSLKIKASRESLEFQYVGFTSEPDYVNIIDQNDPYSRKLKTIDSMLVGQNLGNDYFITINPDTLTCPTNEKYYFSKFFGDSETMNLYLDVSSLWSCEYGISYLNEEKIIFNTGKHLLLGQENSIYLGVKDNSSINKTLDFLSNNYSNYERTIIHYTKSSDQTFSEFTPLILNINSENYLNLGNGLYSKIKINYYQGIDLVNLYKYESSNMNEIITDSALGTFSIIDNYYYVFLKDYILDNENKGLTVQIIKN